MMQPFIHGAMLSIYKGRSYHFEPLLLSVISDIKTVAAQIGNLRSVLRNTLTGKINVEAS